MASCSKRRRIHGKQPDPAASAATPKRAKRATGIAYTIDNRPCCPANDDRTPIEYNGGKIYNTPQKLKVLRNKSDNYTEKSYGLKKWKLSDAFADGLDAIDAWMKNALAGVTSGEDVN